MPTTTSPTLLLAHADRDSRRVLSAQLDLDGYTVHAAPTTTAVIEMLQRTAPTAILLGTLEQPAAALRFLRDLRAGRIDRADAHVAVLTFGANDATSQLRAYENGSDHHLPGDIAYVTLRAILAAVVRRAAGPQAAPRTIELGSLSIDIAAHEVRVAGQPMPLPAKEFELLRTLATDPDRAFTKQELLQSIWGYSDPRTTRTLDSHACRLRRRLAEHGHPGLVHNLWGVGYRLTP